MVLLTSTAWTLSSMLISTMHSLTYSFELQYGWETRMCEPVLSLGRLSQPGDTLFSKEGSGTDRIVVLRRGVPGLTCWGSVWKLRRGGGEL